MRERGGFVWDDWRHETSDAGALHDTRFLLPFGEAPRFFKVDVHARERLAVAAIDGYAPVMMRTAPIFAEFRSFAVGHG